MPEAATMERDIDNHVGYVIAGSGNAGERQVTNHED